MPGQGIASRGSLASPQPATLLETESKTTMLASGSQDVQLRTYEQDPASNLLHWDEKMHWRDPLPRIPASPAQLIFQLGGEGVSCLLHWWHCASVNLEICCLFWTGILCTSSHFKSPSWQKSQTRKIKTCCRQHRAWASSLCICITMPANSLTFSQRTSAFFPLHRDWYYLLKSRSPTACSKHISNALFATWSSSSVQRGISSSVSLSRCYHKRQHSTLWWILGPRFEPTRIWFLKMHNIRQQLLSSLAARKAKTLSKTHLGSLPSGTRTKDSTHDCLGKLV